MTATTLQLPPVDHVKQTPVQQASHNRTVSYGVDSSSSSASGTSQVEGNDAANDSAAAETPAPTQASLPTTRGDLDYEVPEGRLTETQVAISNSFIVDKYGFIKREATNGAASCPSPSNAPKPPQARTQQHFGRINKWLKMMGPQGSNWKAYFAQKPEKVKRRVRKGIPDQVRGLAWQLLSGARDLMDSSPGRFEELLAISNPSLEMEILRDLSRTFPNHVQFHDRQGPGQHSLYQVLRAYSSFDEQVGYVQGMGFIAAVLLIYMAEEEAFWTLVALMKGASVLPIEGMFVPGMPLLQQYMYQFDHLLADEDPRLAAHFRREGVDPSMFCTHWFTTVFAYMMPFEHLLRVWDVFLLEGMKVVFRVGLVLMMGAHQQLVAAGFDRLVAALNSKRYPAFSRPPDELIRAAVRISVSKRLEELRAQYQSAHRHEDSH